MTATRNCAECGAELPVDSPQGLCPQCLLKRALETETTLDDKAASRSAFVPPTPAELAKYFPQLEILELLGQGGMGVVYKARQPRLDRIVALKILPAETGRDPAFAERFSREGKALAKLSHSGIVAIYDFGHAEPFYYFLMEFVDGVNLRQAIRAKQLAPRDALKIVTQICEALQYAHDEGIVHRDIKPGNILVDKKGRVKIADFGLAKLLGRAPADLTLTGTQQVMGTPHYMAPEQRERPGEVDHRADIYSLGVVFYEMLTGDLPIGRFAPPSQKVQVDVRLDEVVLRTLENEPARRYQHASEVKTDVETIASGEIKEGERRQSQEEPEESNPLAVPASGLLVVGIIDCALVLYVLLWTTLVLLQLVHGFIARWELLMFVWPFIAFVNDTLDALDEFIARWELLVVVWSLAASSIKVAAAMATRRAYSREAAALAGTVAVIPYPSPLYLLSLPFGIWMLIRLNKPGVKSALARLRTKAMDSRRGQPGAVQPSPPRHFASGERTLENEPARRYQHASDVKTDVETISRTPPPTAPKDAAVESGGRFKISEALRQQVKGPSMGLLAAGILNWLGSVFLIILLSFNVLSLGTSAHPVLVKNAVGTIGLITFLGSSLIFFGALKMMKFEAYPLAITSSLLAMLLTPGNLIGLPIGIWALVVLTRAEVKAAFRLRRESSLEKKPEREPTTHTPSHKLFFIAKVLFGCALLAPVIMALYVFFIAARSYEARAFLEIGRSAEADIAPILLKPSRGIDVGLAFRESGLKAESGIRLEQARNTSALQVAAAAATPQEAADRANNAAAKMKTALENQKGASASIIGDAEPPLKPIKPNIPLHLAIGAGVGLLLAIGGVAALIGAFVIRIFSNRFNKQGLPVTKES